jgi:hypothetical protein
MKLRVLLIFVLFMTVLVGACNEQIGTPEPITTTPQSTATVITISIVTIPEPSASLIIDKTLIPGPAPFAKLPGCFDDMKILATFGNMPFDESGIFVAWPGENYYLGWRIRNTGSCVWDSAYSLEAVSSVQYRSFETSAPVVLKDRVTPGKSVEVQFNISVALSPGDYPVSWILLNGYHKPVGQELKAIVRVPGDSINNPLPTLTANPNVQFEASSTQVAPYEKVVLSWEVKQASAVYFYSTGQAWVPNQVPLKGVRIFYPTSSAAYNLRVVNSNNTVESYKIEVDVEPPLGLPDIYTFELAPKGQLILGSCVDISWLVRGGLATRISLFVNDNPLVTDADRAGEYTDCPSDIGLKVFTLIASGPAGSVSKSKVINVVP